MEDKRETLTWQAFGDASQELARDIEDDGFRPDLILAIARGGMFVAGALGYALSVKNLHLMNVEFYNGVGATLADVRCAVVYEKPASLVKCDYVWKRTDRWINFPWSSLPPVVLGVLDA
jgi:hypoxanthine phosphoribosyltransferase